MSAWLPVRSGILERPSSGPPSPSPCAGGQPPVALRKFGAGIGGRHSKCERGGDGGLAFRTGIDRGRCSSPKVGCRVPTTEVHQTPHRHEHAGFLLGRECSSRSGPKVRHGGGWRDSGVVGEGTEERGDDGTGWLAAAAAAGRRMRIVGLTGGIASGKSTVSKDLQSRGLTIIDADVIAHDVLRKGTRGWKRVVEIFGKEILLESGEVNRARLGEIVFSDSLKRKELNRALEPFIAFGIFWEIFKNWIWGTAVVVLDAPLLFEAKISRFTKPVVVVWVDPETQEERLLARDHGLSEEQAQNRIRAQLPLSVKRDRADIVIDNSGSLDSTRSQVDELYSKITAPATLQEFAASRSGVLTIFSGVFLVWWLLS